MKIQQFTNRITLLLLSCVVMLSSANARAQKKSKYVCDEAQPENMCNAANSCGSVSAPCTIDITKSGSLSNVKRGIPNAKNNQFFCIKKGTTVVWMTSNKNTGFMISFGTDLPFDPDDPILGGANKQSHGCHARQSSICCRTTSPSTEPRAPHPLAPISARSPSTASRSIGARKIVAISASDLMTHVLACR